MSSKNVSQPASAHPVIVGVGASAGGLDAFKQLLASASSDGGLSYVLIQHLDPTHHSMMAELLEKACDLPVMEISDGQQVEPNCVYVIPPDTYVRLDKNQLALSSPSDPRGSRMAIDVFFRSLAEQRERRAVGIVLSGTGSDGTQGMRAIKAAGGLAIAQDPDSAAHGGMPRSVIDQGLADLVLSPDDMVAAIGEFIEHPYIAQPPDRKMPVKKAIGADEEQEPLEAIAELLRRHTTLDLTNYKETTLYRRIQRRMGVHQIREMPEYVQLLREDDTEMERFVRDLHISVTDFFRDPEAYSTLARDVMPRLFEHANHEEDDEARAIRVWIPGCATGEEAYSIAIQLFELHEQAQTHTPIRIQVFATDVDDDAIRIARDATYPASSMSGVSRERRQRFFSQVDDKDRWRVKQFVRDSISFARHDLMSDPPFSKLDLISCRNLLIYLRQEAQQAALSLFHFSLRQGGYLFLGPSESIGDAENLFRAISPKWRVFQRLDSSERRPPRPVARRFAGSQQSRTKGPDGQERPHARRTTVAVAAQSTLAEACAPPSVIVNQHYTVIYLHGDLIEFLDLPQGETQLSLLHMLREEIRTRVRAAMFRAAREQQTVRTRGQMQARNGDSLDLAVTVRPARSESLGDELLVVSFEAQPTREDDKAPEVAAGEKDLRSELERELQATREDLRSTVQELENANEQLRSSNEEAMTMNEELQSTNEELETQSEELRSVNEELTTVNSQLREKMEELERTHSDIANLLSSTKLPAIFLDENFCIRRYTPEAQKLLNVIETDIGRPLNHLSGVCVEDGLLEDAKSVLDGLTPIEKELRVDSGEWYVRRVLPYRTEDNRIAGVVVTFSNVTSQKAMTEVLSQRERQQTSVTQLGQRALKGLDRETLLQTAVKLLSRTLDCRYAKILELFPEQHELRLVAGVGWKRGLVGKATVPAGPESQAGFTLETNGPVVVRDLASETRFSGPKLLLDHGIKSGLSVVIAGADGKPFGILSVHSKKLREFSQQDVEFVQAMANVLAATLQREAIEADLRANEAKFRTMAENISQLAWMADETGWIFWYNKRWFDYTGTTLEETQGWGWQQVHHPEHVHRVVEKVKHCFDTGTVWEDTFPLRSKEGEYRWFLSRAYPIRNDNGEVVRWFGTNTDITEQLEAQRQIQEQQQQLQAILDNAPAPIYAKDRDGRFMLSNKHHAAFLGSTPEAVVGKCDEDFQPSREDADSYRANDALIWETGKAREFEERVPTEEGERTFISVKFPLRDAKGEIYAVCGISSDITERTEYEAHLRLVMAELNHRVKNTLASVVAIAMQTGSTATDVKAFVKSFENRVQSMAKAHSLLTQSEWKGVHLAELIRDELESRIASEDHLLIEGPSILIPPKEGLSLHMVIHELATNAGKYGALSVPEGRVVIACGLETQSNGRQVSIDWREENGPQVKKPTKKSFGSQMISEVIEYELGGSVEVVWRPEGVHCRMTFPLPEQPRPLERSKPTSDWRDQAGSAPRESASGPPDRPTAPPNSVLLVEDNRSVANMLSQALDEHDVSVVGPATTLAEADKLQSERQFDVALLDVDLKGEKIYEVARRLHDRSIPFALLTGYGTADLPNDLSQGPIFPKPLDLDSLLRWLRIKS